MTRQAYTCQYCEFTGSIDAVRAHESQCIFNPFLRACYSCKLFKERRYEGWMCPKTFKFIISNNTISMNCPHWVNPES